MRLSSRHFLLILVVASGIASAQTQATLPPFSSWGGGPFDRVNLGNLDVHFTIPVLNKAGRGMPFTYDIGYDGLVWSPVTSSGITQWQPANAFGWSNISNAGAGGYISYSVTNSGGSCPINPPYTFGTYTQVEYSGFVYHDPAGFSHYIGYDAYYITQNSGCTSPQTGPQPPTPEPAFASDGSGYTMYATPSPTSVSAYLVKRNGTILYPPLASGPPSGGSWSATDANGNMITESAGAWTDTLGTQVLALAGIAPSNTTLTYVAPSGANASYTVSYTNYTVQTWFKAGAITEYGPLSTPLVNSIMLPDGSSYSFTYEPTPSTANCIPKPGTSSCVTGRIASVALPAGGSITYAYSGIESDGTAASLTRTLSPGGAWLYSRAPTGSTWVTTVSDPNQNQTVINFSGSSQLFYETQRQVYQGSVSPINLLETSIRCYNAVYTGCSTATVSSPIRQADSYGQLPNGSTRLSEVLYNSNGLATDDKEYNYGVTTGVAPGTTDLVRETATSYASLGPNIVNKPSTITVYDWTSGQTKIASTTYTYDQGTPTYTSGTPQHVSITGSRGNLTTLTTSTSSTASLSKTVTYYDTGNPSLVTDVNGAQLTLSYGSGSCGNSFVTSQTLPLGLSVSMTWNCTGGVMTSSTDPNGGAIQTEYNDPKFWQHPSTVIDQALNTTTLSHVSPIASESVLLFNSNQSSVDVVTTLDSMGRPHLAQRRQAPGSTEFDSIETDDDSLGQTVRTTLPYEGTVNQTSSSAPGTTTAYDAMGRVVQLADSGSGVVSKKYVNNDILRTVGPAPSGENTKRKQLEYDGLGRLTSVCELTTLSGSGTCNQTSSQTGYWTKYTLNALGRIVGVIENAQATSTQTRSFGFDMSGRLTSESNPETGRTAYTYDSATGCSSSSNGDLLKRVDAVGNTMCYTYDALHRVTSITYTGSYASKTLSKYFVYDAATVNGTAMVKVKGRLAEAYTATCSTCSKVTDVGFSYSVVGNVSDMYESTPNSGGYYHLTATYWANGSLDVLSGLPGLPTLTYGVDGEGRGYSVTASTGQNPVTSTIYNPNDKPTSVTLGSADSDTFSYDPNTGRLTEYEFTVDGESLTGHLTWNANQSLERLVISDPFNSADSQTCNYAFDDLRRVSNANCGSIWSQTFGYDAFGNISKSGNLSFQPTYSASTNRMTALSGFTPTYDANGNLLTDSAHTYTWDVNGRPVSIDSVNLTYDAFGRMVEQKRSGSYTQVVYAPSGFKLALMNGQTLQKAFVPLPSGAKAVYTSSGLSYYRHPDWLGSSRLASTPSRTIYADVAYAPFGESYASSGNSDLSFTGQNQDTVTGLFDFSDREYNPSQSRWISPDPAGVASVRATNPRSWNRYVYAVDNPLNLVDPNGECAEPGSQPGSPLTLGPGEIGVCIDLYIAAPTIGVVGLGDNRGPVGDDPSSTFRVEFDIVYDPSTNMAEIAYGNGESDVLTQGFGIKGDTTGAIALGQNSDGSFTVSINTDSLNGWDSSTFGIVPGLGSILLDTSLTFSPDGTVTVDGGERSAFPSMEVWTYGNNGGDPYNLISISETNTGDLGDLNQDIPTVSTPSGGDNGTQDGSGSDGSGGGDLGAGDLGGGGGDGGGSDNCDAGGCVASTVPYFQQYLATASTYFMNMI